eukprot:CAMPEP_0197426466 /NCGR_PEP_ID=MMETSP1170-20131217/34944_1 /TAXON_ID=54406 /ORGANISM="Sarcinochrysis sp, Strain CCMP770" /LENGTH=164 /DNA_ID=CAMNT_0042954101 /DNA_START=13 /DNA_END=505 /DNA_ORIENTATION=-
MRFLLIFVRVTSSIDEDAALLDEIFGSIEPPSAEAAQLAPGSGVGLRRRRGGGGRRAPPPRQVPLEGQAVLAEVEEALEAEEELGSDVGDLGGTDGIHLDGMRRLVVGGGLGEVEDARTNLSAADRGDVGDGRRRARRVVLLEDRRAEFLVVLRDPHGETLGTL